MDIRFHSTDKGGCRLDCVVLPVFAEAIASFDARFADTPLSWLSGSEAVRDFSGKNGEISICYGNPAGMVPRVILAGLGPQADCTLETFRAAIAAGIRQCRRLRLPRLALLLEKTPPVADVLGRKRPEMLQEAVLAALLAEYSCTEFRSAEAKAKGKKDNEPDFFSPDSLTILHQGGTIPASLRLAVRLAEAEAAGVRLARDLVNAPANSMTPVRMAEEALGLARRHGFACRVMHKPEMAKLGMGALLAVSEGSRKDPRFIVLEYNPGGTKKRAPLVLVGKGVTFDSGGMSLKPAAGMHAMKGDMAGGAAVLGVFEAIGQFSESVATPVVGLIPCAENMPDGAAARPGDVVTTFSGKTVEILNTDAEGRLILCDALSFAQKNWSPLALVDIATLTGACVVALGRNAAGLFTDSAPLRDAIMDIGGDAGDAFWPMPLWERLREGLKSDVADMANVGAREGGAITAALFLKSFVDKGTPWAHLDMAGAGLMEKDTPLCPKGATGFGVRTLFGLARTVSEKSFK